MCDCGTEINVTLINLYIEMAEYKKNSKALNGVRLASKSGEGTEKEENQERVDFRTELSQEQLAYAYEELNITDWIDKTDKSNEKTTSSAKKTSNTTGTTSNGST
tara:strand:- start:221 stop:535 length:315 start_codon:yes stop_codon:yes gene_type:complete